MFMHESKRQVAQKITNALRREKQRQRRRPNSNPWIQSKSTTQRQNRPIERTSSTEHQIKTQDQSKMELAGWTWYFVRYTKHLAPSSSSTTIITTTNENGHPLRYPGNGPLAPARESIPKADMSESLTRKRHRRLEMVKSSKVISASRQPGSLKAKDTLHRRLRRDWTEAETRKQNEKEKENATFCRHRSWSGKLPL